MALVLAAPLLILLTAWVAYALANLQHSQSVGWVSWLAGTVENIALLGPRLAAHILRLDKWMTHVLGNHFKQVEAKAVGWVVGLKQYAGWMAASAVAPAAAMWSFAWWVVHSEIPRQIHARTKATSATATKAQATATKAQATAAAVAKSHPGTVKGSTVTKIERVAMPHAEEWSWIHHHWKALTLAVTAPVALPGVVGLPEARRWFGWTRRNLRWHNKRIARLEKLLGVGVFAATMAKVLGVSAKCLGRNGNVGKMARALCGAPTHLLNDLLGVLADVWILENVCVLLPFLESAASAVGTPLVEALTVAGAGICKGSAAPGSLQGESPNLPNNQLGALALV